MKAFIGQNYPTLGDPATLTVVPDLPEPETGMTMADMVRTMYSSMGSKGGLLEGHPDIPTILADPNLDPACAFQFSTNLRPLVKADIY